MDFDVGETCPLLECSGVLRRVGDGACACHINPPCSWCSNPTLGCSECGWEGDSADYRRAYQPAFIGVPAPVLHSAPAPILADRPAILAQREPEEADQRWKEEWKEEWRRGKLRGVKRVGFLTDWGQWIWSTWWGVFDGSAETECSAMVFAERERRRKSGIV